MTLPICDTITLRPFDPKDQDAAKDLILAGLQEHWGVLDLTLNPDLNDIATTYADGLFLVVCCGDRIVGTGALLPTDPAPASRTSGLAVRADSAEIARMSVAADMRRRGIGHRILGALCDYARARGIRNLTLETTSTWHDVIAFYEAFGFRITHTQGGDTYFVLDL